MEGQTLLRLGPRHHHPQPLSWSTSAALAEDFAESDLPFKVDIVDWAVTSAAFRKIIERDKVVLQSGDGL